MDNFFKVQRSQPKPLFVTGKTWARGTTQYILFHQTFRSVPKMEESENLYKHILAVCKIGLCIQGKNPPEKKKKAL